MFLSRCIFLIAALTITCAGSESQSREGPVVRGTINVVLANQNGIVAVTDSRQSYHASPSGPLQPWPEPAQKLFQLDDHTICTIAGFGSAPAVAFPKFQSSSIGVLKVFRTEMEQAGASLTFDEKLHGIASAFKLQLQVIANLRKTNIPDDYHFQLIMAGYDVDGALKVGTIDLQMTLDPDGLVGLQDVDVWSDSVGNKFEHLVTGHPAAVANAILERPADNDPDSIIRAYGEAKSRDGGASLTIQQLRDLASVLAHRAAVGDITVGGPDQIAVLAGGKIQNLVQPTLPTPDPPSVPYAVMFANKDMNGIELFNFHQPLILIKCEVTNKTSYSLDNKYFYKSTISNSRVTYDGGPVGLDDSDQISNSYLILGPNSRNSFATVLLLRSKFSWKRVIDHSRAMARR